MVEFELLRVSNDMRWDGTWMRPAIMARKAGEWADLVKCDKLNVWTSAKLRECYSEVEQEDDERQSICAADSAEEHGLPEADRRASRRTCRGHRYPLEVCV